MKRDIALLGACILLAMFLTGGIIFLWHEGRMMLPPAIAQGLRRVGATFARLPLYPKPKPTILLDVPFYKQEHALSCEVAALRMALAGVDVEIEESELIRLLPFDTTPKRRGVWGDPNVGFVGDIDGKMLVDGYGVYAEPIRDLGGQWRRTAILAKPTAVAITNAVANRAPVIVWGYFGGGARYTWKTPEEKTITAISAEHARVVIGFAGEQENPEGFFVIDPKYGQQYWKIGEFMENWDALDRMHVVVYPEEQPLE